MNLDCGVVMPLWSFVADDGALLDRLVGEVGLDHLTVPAVTGSVWQFRLGVSQEPAFHSDGGWHFPPAAKNYGSTGLKPSKARWFGSADVLGRLRDQLDRLSLPLVLRVDLRAVLPVVVNEPTLSQRNAWGQEVLSAGACACNPNLRDMLEATLADVERYEPAGVQIVAWLPDRPVDWVSSRPLEWHEVARDLLDTCFCPSCRQVAQHADVDADEAAEQVRAAVAAVPESPPADATVGVEAYVAARQADCVDWLRQLAGRHAVGTIQHVHLVGDNMLVGDAEGIADMARLPAEAGLLDDEDWDTLLRGPDRLSASGLSLPVWRPVFTNSTQFVRVVSDAVGIGVTTLDFEGADEAAPECVTWLRQALRKARRA